MLSWTLLVAALLFTQTPPPAPAGGPALDYEYFKTKVQPIFMSRRPGHARCVACHVDGTPLRLQRPAAGAIPWDEEASRKNFDAVRRVVVPGSMQSKLLLHPLAPEAGGDAFHTGGPQFASKDDKEWRILADWVRGASGTGASR
jgi:hypothetical protein